jgi:hypothetical protein
MGKSFCLVGIAKTSISNFNTTHRVRVISPISTAAAFLPHRKGEFESLVVLILLCESNAI